MAEKKVRSREPDEAYVLIRGRGGRSISVTIGDPGQHPWWPRVLLAIVLLVLLVGVSQAIALGAPTQAQAFAQALGVFLRTLIGVP
jgi:hypothetical protein